MLKCACHFVKTESPLKNRIQKFFYGGLLWGSANAPVKSRNNREICRICPCGDK